MIKIIEQTQEEKIEMYSKISKRKLIDMLISCNNALNNRPLMVYSNESFLDEGTKNLMSKVIEQEIEIDKLNKKIEQNTLKLHSNNLDVITYQGVINSLIKKI